MTRLSRMILLWLCLACLAWAEQITILGINDLHANMQRLPRLASIVKEQRAAEPDLLLFSAGDHSTGDPVSDLSPVFRGWPVIDIMNRLGVDVSCIGNHEFDGGVGVLRQAMDAARFPFVCANMHASASLGLSHQPYVILEHKGLKIGVLGVVTRLANGYPSRDSSLMEGLSFDDPLQVALKYRWLRDECDVLVLLTHIGYAQDRELAERFPEADVIIGGHTGTLLREGVTEHGVLITQAGDRAEALTKIVLEVEDRRVISGRAEICLADEAEPDKEMLEVIEAFDKPSSEPLAQNLAEMSGLEAGCLICEALREGTGADVAVINGGGVRVKSLPKGTLSAADVYRVDPFCNTTIVVTLSGRELLEVLQAVMDADRGRPACVAGLRYEYEAGSGKTPRAVRVCLSDGSPLEPDKLYSLATHSYVGRVVLKNRDGKHLDTLTEQFLIRYLQEHRQIDRSALQNVILPPDLQPRR